MSYFLFTQPINTNHFLARFVAALEYDAAFGDFQFFGKEPAQRGVRLSFRSGRAQLDLDRTGGRARINL